MVLYSIAVETDAATLHIQEILKILRRYTQNLQFSYRDFSLLSRCAVKFVKNCKFIEKTYKFRGKFMKN